MSMLFFTGYPGFLGSRLLPRILRRTEGTHATCLVQPAVAELARRRLEDQDFAEPDLRGRVTLVEGDISRADLGLGAAVRRIGSEVSEVYHLAAIYDMNADAESQQRANVDGTRNAVQCAEKLEAGCFEHVSSIAASGLYRGTFREDMFEEAENLDHPYFSTKHDSEGIVRDECQVPWRVFRPGMVVGHSKTGEIDKIDGAYYFFKSLQKIRRVLPPWWEKNIIEMNSSSRFTLAAD